MCVTGSLLVHLFAECQMTTTATATAAVAMTTGATTTTPTQPSTTLATTMAATTTPTQYDSGNDDGGDNSSGNGDDGDTMDTTRHGHRHQRHAQQSAPTRQLPLPVSLQRDDATTEDARQPVMRYGQVRVVVRSNMSSCVRMISIRLCITSSHPCVVCHTFVQRRDTAHRTTCAARNDPLQHHTAPHICHIVASGIAHVVLVLV